MLEVSKDITNATRPNRSIPTARTIEISQTQTKLMSDSSSRPFGILAKVENGFHVCRGGEKLSRIHPPQLGGPEMADDLKSFFASAIPCQISLAHARPTHFILPEDHPTSAILFGHSVFFFSPSLGERQDTIYPNSTSYE